MQADGERGDAQAIWRAGVAAVQPERCLRDWFEQGGLDACGLAPLTSFERVRVVGAGKAGAAMAQALEGLLEGQGVELANVVGLVNVPNETVVPLRAIRLHPARPAGTNQPTEEACAGTAAILEVVRAAGPNDLLLCLISGGGSALLPAPVAGVTLADKQAVTALLHRCGATIQEMNTVRKHLSRVKGGGLVRAFRGRRVLSLIISDVIGDPLDVIASGPTCVDPTTFDDALAVLKKYELLEQAPPAALGYLRRGAAGQEPETLKEWPLDEQGQPIVHNCVIANNRRALDAAGQHAEASGFRVMNLGSFLDGETRLVAEVMAGIARGQRDGLRSAEGGGGKSLETESQTAKPIAILSGGETTVTLGPGHGLGGRNQEFVLAFLNKLGPRHLEGITVLSGGTDGEDGPSDAAGALGDTELLAEAARRGLAGETYLARHDAYHFFEATGGLLKTGLTHTNVMDLRVILVAG